MTVTGRTEGAHDVAVDVAGEGHVGYLGSSRIVAEAGLMLAEAKAIPARAGYLTPATALGTGCVEHLALGGLRFAIR